MKAVHHIAWSPEAPDGSKLSVSPTLQGCKRIDNISDITVETYLAFSASNVNKHTLVTEGPQHGPCVRRRGGRGGSPVQGQGPLASYERA
ncbi:unnamed protein product [Colias eurytheme]|nr:unnamed protein product [Colias eurytheme]